MILWFLMGIKGHVNDETSKDKIQLMKLIHLINLCENYSVYAKHKENKPWTTALVDRLNLQ